jgi:hypothetical protein
VSRVQTAERPTATDAGHLRPRRLPQSISLSLLVVAVPAIVGAVRLLIALPRPFLAGGDAAFMELSVRRALGFDQLLGPYSRFAWNHPGPILFYLFAPLYWLSGRRSRSLFLNAWLLNLGCVVAVVAVIRHRLGEGAARVVAALLALFLVATKFHNLINPWNPSLLGIPFLLLVVLGADASGGSVASLIAAAAVGTYLVQTHIGMLPVVGVTLALAVAGWVVSQTRSPDAVDPHRRRRALLAGAVLLGVLWAGPVVDQFTASPGNAGKIVRFFRDPSGETRGHSLGDAGVAVAKAATRPFAGLGVEHHPVAALFGTGILGGLVAVAARRRSPFAARLGALGAVNVAVGVVATTRVVGELYPYLFDWTPALLFPPVAAAGLAGLDTARQLAPSRPPARQIRAVVGAVGMAAVLAIGALSVAATADSETASFEDSPAAAPAARLIEDHVGHDRKRVFQIHVVDGTFQTASLLLRLERDGYRFRMTPPYGLYTGSTDRPPDDGVSIVVVGTQLSLVPPGAEPLGTVGPLVLKTVNRLG